VHPVWRMAGTFVTMEEIHNVKFLASYFAGVYSRQRDLEKKYIYIYISIFLVG